MNNKNIKQSTVQFFKNHPHSSPILRRLGNKRQIPVYATEFVRISDIVPKQWDGWFYSMLSETSKFTWGDNNRSMVVANDIAVASEELIDLAEESVPPYAFREWLKKIRRLGDMYVDLEN